MLRYFALILFLFLLPVGKALAAQPQTDYSLQLQTDNDEIANFPLTERILENLEKIQSELPTIPIENDAPGTGDDMTIIGMTEAVEGRPNLMTLLKKYDISARDYVVSSMAIAAAFEASISNDQDYISDTTHRVSKENIEFAKTYTDRIRKLLGS